MVYVRVHENFSSFSVPSFYLLPPENPFLFPVFFLALCKKFGREDGVLAWLEIRVKEARRTPCF